MPIVTCVPDNFGSRYCLRAHGDGVDNATMASSPSSTAGNRGVGVLGVVGAAAAAQRKPRAGVEVTGCCCSSREETWGSGSRSGSQDAAAATA